MKPIFVIWMTLLLGFLQTGCGTQIGLSGQAREDYLKSIKPYLHYWEKTGITPENRRADSVDCGARPNKGVKSDDLDFDESAIAAARFPGEPEIKTYHRFRFEWQRCMLKAGYRFTGDCRIEFPESPVSCPVR